MTKIQKTIDGKTYDFWKLTEAELAAMKEELIAKKNGIEKKKDKKEQKEKLKK